MPCEHPHGVMAAFGLFSTTNLRFTSPTHSTFGCTKATYGMWAALAR
jgi:hypothetical protein